MKGKKPLPPASFLPPSTDMLVVDVEATCSEDATVPRDEMEVIELGAVLVSSGTLEIYGEFQAFIRPVHHPQLTPFCQQLTAIHQEDVEKASSLPEVMEALKSFLAGRPVLFCSWGGFDRGILRRECAQKQAIYPFDERHWNLKERFSARLSERRQYGVSRALARAGLRFEGQPHRGLDDARNVARLLPFILGVVPFPVLETDGAPPSVPSDPDPVGALSSHAADPRLLAQD